jgi:hypothetical protein
LLRLAAAGALALRYRPVVNRVQARFRLRVNPGDFAQ